MIQAMFNRMDDFTTKHAPAVIGTVFLVLIAAAVVVSVAVSSSSKADYDAAMAQHAENHRALVSLVESNYGATDVAYNGGSMTITVNERALQCEGVTPEAIKEKKALRCAPLEVVEAVTLTAP